MGLVLAQLGGERFREQLSAAGSDIMNTVLGQPGLDALRGATPEVAALAVRVRTHGEGGASAAVPGVEVDGSEFRQCREISRGNRRAQPVEGVADRQVLRLGERGDQGDQGLRRGQARLGVERCRDAPLKLEHRRDGARFE
jgi:hypothetical protein